MRGGCTVVIHCTPSELHVSHTFRESGRVGWTTDGGVQRARKVACRARGHRHTHRKHVKRPDGEDQQENALPRTQLLLQRLGHNVQPAELDGDDQAGRGNVEVLVHPLLEKRPDKHIHLVAVNLVAPNDLRQRVEMKGQRRGVRAKV